ncbi:MAG: hypothetical protein ABI454_11225 [Sphingomicrobium sp.]
MAKGKKKKNEKNRDNAKSTGAEMGKRLREISQNPLVADVVVATLVAAASALKDSKKARQLAANAGDELQKLGQEGADHGKALWQLALDVGRKTVEALAGDESPKRRKAKVQSSKKADSTKRPKTKTRSSKNPKK